MRIGAPPEVRITQQSRESKNATYELDCSGLPLAIRVSAPVDNDPASAWRIEVSAATVIVCASAGSRALAFALLVERWGSAASPAYRDLDWQAIGAAMTAVRAL